MNKTETLALLAVGATAAGFAIGQLSKKRGSAPDRAYQVPKKQRTNVQNNTNQGGSSGGGGAKQAPSPEYIGDGENDEVGINDMSPDEETEEETTEGADESDG